MSTLRPICVVFYPQSLLLPQFSLFFNVRDVAAVYSESASHIFEDPYVFEVHLAQIHVWLVVLDRLVHVGSDHLVGRREIRKDIFRGRCVLCSRYVDLQILPFPKSSPCRICSTSRRYPDLWWNRRWGCVCLVDRIFWLRLHIPVWSVVYTVISLAPTCPGIMV